MSALDYFHQTFILLTSSLNVDDSGLAYYSFTNGGSFPCRIQTLQDRRRVMSQNERIINDRSVEFSTHRLYCSKGLTFSFTDRIQVGVLLFSIVTVNYLNEEAAHVEIDLKLLTL